MVKHVAVQQLHVAPNMNNKNRTWRNVRQVLFFDIISAFQACARDNP